MYGWLGLRQADGLPYPGILQHKRLQQWPAPTTETAAAGLPVVAPAAAAKVAACHRQPSAQQAARRNGKACSRNALQYQQHKQSSKLKTLATKA